MFKTLWHSLKNSILTLARGKTLLLSLTSLVVTALLLAGLIFLVNFALSHVQILPFAWLDTLFDTAGTVLAGFLVWVLFPAFMPIIASLFQESLIHSIEVKDYPDHVAAGSLSLSADLKQGLLFTLTLIGINLLLLPVYFTGIGIVAFYVANSYLIGREFFEVVATRHSSEVDILALRKRHRLLVSLAGACLMIISSLPGLQLIAPFLGVTLMTHLFHALRG